MPIDLPQRMHAFANSIGKPSDTKVAKQLYDEVHQQFRTHHMVDDNGRGRLIVVLAEAVLTTFGLPEDHSQLVPIAGLIKELFDYEKLFVLPEIDWQAKHSTSEWWDFHSNLNRQKSLFSDFDQTCEHIRILTCHIWAELFRACPSLKDGSTGDGIVIPSELLHMIGNVGELVHKFADLPFGKKSVEDGIFDTLRPQLEATLILASGGNPVDPSSFNRAPKYANKSEIRNPDELIKTYLRETPLASIFDQTIDFTIPAKSRFEHHHIIAGSGHGKTQTLQYLIARDLEAVQQGKQSLIVLDSQGDLIRNISNLALFAPDGPLHDRIVIIDPTDIEYPVSLNLFDIGQDRLVGQKPLERERLTNSILELYDFVLGSLLSAEMTQKQTVIFRYVTRLMLHIPGATIHTLRGLMEPGSDKKFAEHIAKLSGTARHFFETEFASKEFEQTKKQVLRRLWGILENQTFERMFSHPKSKLDLYSEMNAGKVILINTAKDLLKESGTEIFGRFFIALIAQAAQERAVLSKSNRKSTICYIDEAADYFDRNIGIILSQARKYNVGMVLAHQYLGQLDPKLQEAFAANTAIKFAGGVSAKDARTLAGQMYCEPSLIESQSKGSFATHIRSVTSHAIPLKFPFGYLEDLPKMSKPDRKVLKNKMREQYAVHHSELDRVGETQEENARVDGDSNSESGSPETTYDITPTKTW